MLLPVAFSRLRQTGFLEACLVSTPELQSEKVGVSTIPPHEGVMAARLDDCADFDEMNAVRLDNRVQAMRNDKGRPSFTQAADGVVHLALGFAVERGCRLVEQDQPRILEHGSRNGDALPLSGRELRADSPTGLP